ncbi:MAG: hypothetical protein NWE93_14405 [Candidatus Bathyarchaeota archaeon]|nr:hypothetical protein [Candidatus Bathyarchaeota archaeon]
MTEQTVDLGVEEAFSKVKSALVGDGCRVLGEESGSMLVVSQGSLMGIAPRTAKKTLKVEFESAEKRTTLRYASTIARDWKYVTLIGCVFAVILAAVCLWMAWDLDTFMATEQTSAWSWLISAYGTVDYPVGRAFAALVSGLAVFLFAVVAIEAVVYVNVKAKINQYAQEILGKIS